MRPTAPAGYRPTAPASNPQIGRAIPSGDNSAPAGTVHSKSILVLADAPFANTLAIGTDPTLSPTIYPSKTETTVQGPLIRLVHYDGTSFYITTDRLFDPAPPGQEQPWNGNLYSIALEQAPIEGGWSAGMTAQQVAEYLARECGRLETAALTTGEINGLPCTKANWPWKVRAEYLNISGTMRWCVSFEDDYPAGTANEYRGQQIYIPGIGANTQTQALIGFREIIHLPGERGYDMVPAHGGYPRMLPLASAPNGSSTVIDPFEIGNIS